MEKEQIKVWKDYFVTQHLSKVVSVVTTKATDTEGEIEVRYISGLSTWSVNYTWEHNLFTEGREVLDDKNWYVYFAYTNNKEQIILLKHRLFENFFFKGTYSALKGKNGAHVLAVSPVQIKKNEIKTLYAGDMKELKSFSFQKKRKELDEFFYNWILKNSSERLRILSGNIKITRDEEK